MSKLNNYVKTTVIVGLFYILSISTSISAEFCDNKTDGTPCRTSEQTDGVCKSVEGILGTAKYCGSN